MRVSLVIARHLDARHVDTRHVDARHVAARHVDARHVDARQVYARHVEARQRNARLLRMSATQCIADERNAEHRGVLRLGGHGRWNACLLSEVFGKRSGHPRGGMD